MRLACLAAACALALCGYLWATAPGVDESSLRETSGIDVRVDGVRRSAAGVAVVCIVENRTGREAASVVFTVDLATEDGRVLVTNPLGNVLRLRPGESRTAQVNFPTFAPGSAHPVARVSLVRWKE